MKKSKVQRSWQNLPVRYRLEVIRVLAEIKIARSSIRYGGIWDEAFEAALRLLERTKKRKR